MNRQSVIVILMGAIASISGLATADFLRQRRCGELEGIWTAADRQCLLPSGEITGTLSLGIVLAGVLVAAAAGFTLYRAYLFATGRARGLASRQET